MCLKQFSLPISASDGRAGRQTSPLFFRLDCVFGVRRRGGVGRVISGVASSMSAKTASPARICCHRNAAGEMDRRGCRRVSHCILPIKIDGRALNVAVEGKGPWVEDD